MDRSMLLELQSKIQSKDGDIIELKKQYRLEKKRYEQEKQQIYSNFVKFINGVA